MKKTTDLQPLETLLPPNSSYYGLAGLLISVLSLLMLIGFFFLPESTGGGWIDIVGTIMLFGGIFLLCIGFICSIVNLCEKDKNKTLGIIGLIISLSTGLLTLFIIILGTIGVMMEQ